MLLYYSEKSGYVPSWLNIHATSSVVDARIIRVGICRFPLKNDGSMHCIRRTLLPVSFFLYIFVKCHTIHIQILITNEHSPPMNTCTHTLPLWAPLKDWLAWSYDSRSRSKSVSLSTGMSPITERIISRKYAIPTSNLEFELGWIDSTTRKLTIWARLSLPHLSDSWDCFFCLFLYSNYN
jgi:hypothetical protein